MRRPSPTLRLLTAILAAGCLNALGVAAQDGPRHVPNLDAMVVTATDVMVGRYVETFSPVVTAAGRTWTFVVEKKLKGDASDPTPALVKVPKATLDAWKTKGHRLLVVYGIGEGLPSVIDLSAPDLKVLRADLTVLRDAGSIIAAADYAIRTHSGISEIETFLRTTSPPTAGMLFPGVNCVPENAYSLCPVTKVPVDAALEEWAVDGIQSEHVWERAEAAGALGHFRSDANITRLKALLDDPGLQPHAADGSVYLVRRRAYEALASMGVHVPEPAARP